MKAAFTQLQPISDESLVDSMKLEEVRTCELSESQRCCCDRLAIAARQIIVTCIFANFEKFCGVDPDTGGFSTFINNVQWDLPSVPWDWSAAPPPPPPTGNTDSKGHYLELDPLGTVNDA